MQSEVIEIYAKKIENVLTYGITRLMRMLHSFKQKYILVYRADIT